MNKKYLKTMLITSAILLLPILAGLVLWHELPQQLPTHWNAQGEIDGWSNKPFAVFGLPLILLATHWLVSVAVLADPKNRNHTGKILHVTFWLLPVLSVMVSALTYAAALGHTVRMELILPLLSGLMFVIIGNYLPKCKQNYTVGIKLPWTLHSEENWNKTHRLAGFLWVACGLVMIVAGFFGAFWAFLAVILVMALVPPIYSYILHRKGI